MDPVRPGSPGIAVRETTLGLLLLALAWMIWSEMQAMPPPPPYARLGPAVVPMFAGAALGLLSLVLIVQGLRGGWQPAEEREVATDWRAQGFVVAGLVFNLLTISTIGFTAASVVMFTLVAYGFGSRRPLRDAAMALVFALLCYFGFARTLGINIGSGVIEQLVEPVLLRLLALVGLG